MRVWEVEDGSIPTDLVREQDFILRIRRLQRLGTQHLVINLALSKLINMTETAEAQQDLLKKLAEFARINQASLAEMSNGDVFLIWDKDQAAEPLAVRILNLIRDANYRFENKDEFLIVAHLPHDYAALRERANHYVEMVQAITSAAPESPAHALNSEAARGPLTAWSVDQIGKLLHDIDLQPYVRHQKIYRHIKDNAAVAWQPVAEEYFVSFEDLRRDRFPILQMITPEHLFLALCETFDHNLLTAQLQNIGALAKHPVHLNIAVASVIGPAFARFTHAVPQETRANVTFELHRGDLFQDFGVTLGAIQTLRREGFKIALDAITPDLARYVDLAAFDVDFIKINVSRERADELGQAHIRKNLDTIPPEKLIFFRCDSQRALLHGLELGVSLFQGWLIDDAMKI